jgi:hypothetical protein
MRLPRWLKTTLAGIGITVGVLALVLVIARASFRRVGERELARMHTMLDAGDPGWRLDDVLDAREKAAPPPERNPAVVAERVREKYPPGWQEFRNTRDGGGPVTSELPGFWAVAWLLQAAPASADARETARAGFLRPEVAAERGGYVRLNVPDNPFSTLLPHTQELRGVADLLAIDAHLAVLEGRPDRGVAAARAGLVAGRALGDEPFLISQLVRIACGNMAATAGMQTLAWGEPKDKAGLAAFQAALRAEADHPWLTTGLRGERAALDRVFEGLETGKVTPREVLLGIGVRENPFVGVGFELYRGFLPGDRAMSLKLFTEMTEAAKKPPHEQRRAFQDIKYPFSDADRFRYIVTRTTLPAAHKVCEASIRARATLLTASAAVACERFRLDRGRWPESLEEIPADVLPPLPPDPYTGGPLQFRRMTDGVLVFAMADDLRLETQPAAVPQDPLAGIGRGWKLWDPELRGRPGRAPDPPPLDATEDPEP